MTQKSIAELSFVETLHCGRDFWVGNPTGDYEKDCELGQRLALEYLAFAESADSSILQNIVAHMPRPLTGVETAFLELVGIAAAGGAGRARKYLANWQNAATRWIGRSSE